MGKKNRGNRKENEVVLPNGKSVFLISHSGVNGWNPETADELNYLFAHGENTSIHYHEKGVEFTSIDSLISVIGLYDLDDDVAWSHKTRAYSPNWCELLLGDYVVA